jgi:hypothetical protein
MQMRIPSVIVVSVLVAASGATAEEERPSGRPYRLSAGALLEYTDNRDSVESGKEDAWSVSLFGGVDLLIETPRMNLEAGYQPFVLHRMNPSDSQNDNDLYHRLNADLRYRVTPRLRLRLSEGFNYTDDPAVDAGGAVIRRDASYLFNRASVGGAGNLTPRLQLDASVHSMLKRYDEKRVADIGDEDSLGGSLSSVYDVDPQTVAGVVATLSKFNYANDSLLGADRGFSSIEGGVFATRAFSPTWGGRFDVGYKRLEYDLGEMGSSSAPYGRAAVRARVGARTSVQASLGYALRDSDAVGFASQGYTDGSMELAWQAVPERLTVTVSAAYRRGEYDADDLLPGAAEAREAVGLRNEGAETVLTASAEVVYRVRNLLSVSLLQQCEDTDSDVATSFRRNSTRASVKAEF